MAANWMNKGVPMKMPTKTRGSQIWLPKATTREKAQT
jgi:hypothetical protein